MRANKVGALVILAVLLALVCVASPLAGANPPAGAPLAQQGVHLAASVAPLLQYQGRLLDAPTGDPVADGAHTMVFRIYNVETEGSALWTETKDVPVANGLFSTVLGDTTALDQALFNNGQALWLGVKVGTDDEAAPRQPLLPVAYALGLAPGAVIDVDNADIADGALSPAKIAGTAWTGANDGAGSGLDADLVDGQEASAFAGASHEHDARYYTEGEADGRFLNTTGPDTISGSSADPILEVNQSGGGYGIGVNTANSYGIWSETNGSHAAVVGFNNAGTGGGVIGESDNGPGVSGISGTSYGGQFMSGSGTALLAQGDAEVTGDLSVGGAITYSSPRTHYLVVGGEGFLPGSNVNYYNTYGCGGAYVSATGFHALVAPVHLPHGATVTQFKVFFNDASANDMSVTLYSQYLSSCGYASLAAVSSSGTTGYYNLTDSSITEAEATIDNTSRSYHVYAYSSSWDTNLRIKGALITYTIDEAP